MGEIVLSSYTSNLSLPHCQTTKKSVGESERGWRPCFSPQHNGFIGGKMNCWYVQWVEVSTLLYILKAVAVLNSTANSKSSGSSLKGSCWCWLCWWVLDCKYSDLKWGGGWSCVCVCMCDCECGVLSFGRHSNQVISVPQLHIPSL